jgi:hypothetical protein
MLARLNHKAARQHLHDAVAKGDPTGTLDIRRKYRAALEMRWRKLGAQLRMVLVTQDMLGLGGKTTVLSLSMTSLAPDGVLRSFQNWLDTTLKKVVLQDEATYLDPMIEVTFKRALVRAMRLTKNKAMPADARETIGTLQQLTLMELQGIVEALSQRIVRLASWAQLDNVKPPVLIRQVLLAIDQVGVTRGRALIESMVVKAHSTATLDQFEAAGVKNVGLLPEVVRKPTARKRLGDAVQPAKTRGTKTEVPSKRTVQRIAGEEKVVEAAFGTEMVEIETAGDDLVCPECESLAADGPYTIDEARGLIPAHPWCRCAFVPEGTDLFGMANLDSFEESQHPRDPGGQGGGQFVSKAEAGIPLAEEDVAKVKGSWDEIAKDRKRLAAATDPAQQSILKRRIIASLEKMRQKYLKKGDLTSAGEIEAKINKWAKVYKVPSPIQAATTAAQSNPANYSPAVTASAEKVMKAEGVTYTPEEKAHFNSLVGVSNEQSAKSYTLHAKANLSNAPAGMTAGELAHVSAYTGSAYGPVNKQLRAGVMDERTWDHTNRLNAALDKFPDHVGTVYRKATLHENAGLYRPGMIVEERAFTSTSKRSGTWHGATHFEITSRTGKDVSRVSSHKGEAEVLFKSGVRFKVISNHGGRIKMEEMTWR